MTRFTHICAKLQSSLLILIRLIFSTLLKKIELHGNHQETNLPSPNFYNWYENIVRKDLIFIICSHSVFAALAVHTTHFFLQKRRSYFFNC